MIQDISPQRLFNEYRPEPPRPEDTIFVFRGRSVLAHLKDGVLAFPKAAEFRDVSSFDYLFRIDDRRFYLSRGEIFPRGYDLIGISELRHGVPQMLGFAGATAWHLHVWYRDNVHCGRCGELTEPSGTERARVCPACHNIIYPKIAPAVIVAVTDGDRILMTRYAGREYTGHALVAGFCEIGETAEQTVRREVREETGIEVCDIRYYGSQPWGFDSNLLLGYVAKLDGYDSLRIDKNELAMAEWVRREDITEEPDNISLTREMMMRFKAGSL